MKATIHLSRRNAATYQLEDGRKITTGKSAVYELARTLIALGFPEDEWLETYHRDGTASTSGRLHDLAHWQIVEPDGQRISRRKWIPHPNQQQPGSAG